MYWPKCQDVRSLRGDFFHCLEHFLARLAEPQHHSRLRRHIRRHFARPPQQFERALVHCAFAHLAVEPRHRLHIVVQHVGPCRHHRAQRRPVTAKIRYQHFHFAIGNALANLGDRARENRRASVMLVVAIHGRDHRVAQSHPLDRLGHAPGLVFFRRPEWFAARHRAKSARTRADISQNHESCRAMFPALAHVRASRALAHRVQFERAHDPVELPEIFPAGKSHLQPRWPRLRARRRRGIVRQDVERSSHFSVAAFQAHLILRI